MALDPKIDATWRGCPRPPRRCPWWKCARPPRPAWARCTARWKTWLTCAPTWRRATTARPARALTPAGAPPGAVLPALVYAHGGGWFLCSLELYDNPCRALANATGCMVLSVDWLAPEHKFPVPVEDFYCALRWVCEQAGMLGVDPARIAVGGERRRHLAAAAAIMARDRGGPGSRTSCCAIPCWTIPSAPIRIAPMGRISS